jgi:hypothetical protein
MSVCTDDYKTKRRRNVQVILLEEGGLFSGAIHLIEEAEGTLSPDDKPAEMTTGSELEEVKAGDVHKLDTGYVAEGLDNAVVGLEDDERATTLAVATVAELALTGTELTRAGDLGDIGVGAETLEESDGLLGLLERLSGVADNEGNLLDLLNAVTTSKDERREGRGSQSRHHGEAALVLVHLDVPLAPGLGRGEHATTAAHVAERGLYYFAINICFIA